jgi:hypothetical protein
LVERRMWLRQNFGISNRKPMEDISCGDTVAGAVSSINRPPPRSISRDPSLFTHT